MRAGQDFGFTSDCMTEWCESVWDSVKPNAQRSYSKPNQMGKTFDNKNSRENLFILMGTFQYVKETTTTMILDAGEMHFSLHLTTFEY